MVVTPKKYFLARLAIPNKNDAPSSCFISHQASSTISILFLSSLLTIFQMKCKITYIATGRNSSSISLIEKTTNLFLISRLVGIFKKKEEKKSKEFFNPPHTQFPPR